MLGRSQISLRALFAITAYIAMSLVALRYPWDGWSGVFRSIAVIALSYVALALIYSSGIQRAALLGFATFASPHLLIVLFASPNTRSGFFPEAVFAFGLTVRREWLIPIAVSWGFVLGLAGSVVGQYLHHRQTR